MFDERDARDLLEQGLDALDWLHAQTPQILHRDIKPDNILVKGYDPLEIRLTDFGLSKQSENFDTSVGTPRYKAPELLSARKDGYTDKVDVWSLGAVVLECTDVETFDVWHGEFTESSEDSKYESSQRTGLQNASTWPECLVAAETNLLEDPRLSGIDEHKRRRITFVLAYLTVLDYEKRRSAHDCLKAVKRLPRPPRHSHQRDRKASSRPYMPGPSQPGDPDYPIPSPNTVVVGYGEDGSNMVPETVSVDADLISSTRAADTIDKSTEGGYDHYPDLYHHAPYQGAGGYDQGPSNDYSQCTTHAGGSGELVRDEDLDTEGIGAQYGGSPSASEHPRTLHIPSSMSDVEYTGLATGPTTGQQEQPSAEGKGKGKKEETVDQGSTSQMLGVEYDNVEDQEDAYYDDGSYSHQREIYYDHYGAQYAGNEPESSHHGAYPSSYSSTWKAWKESKPKEGKHKEKERRSGCEGLLP